MRRIVNIKQNEGNGDLGINGINPWIEKMRIEGANYTCEDKLHADAINVQ